MIKLKIILCTIIVLSMSVAQNAYAQAYKIGETIKDFTYTNGEGKSAKFSDAYGKNKGVILIFTCNTCPYAKAYESRIIGLHRKYASLGYPVFAINPNLKKGDEKADIKKRIKEKKIPYEYVLDNLKNPIYKLFDAQKTPEVFLLEKKEDGFVLTYSGAIDDNFEDMNAVKEKYVEKAVDELLALRPVSTTHTVAIGCTVKR